MCELTDRSFLNAGARFGVESAMMEICMRPYWSGLHSVEVSTPGALPLEVGYVAYCLHYCQSHRMRIEKSPR